MAISVVVQSSYLQHHWRVLMDSVQIFLGQRTASESEIKLLYLLGLGFASLVVMASEVTHRRNGWRQVTGATIIAAILFALIPLAVTYSVVWPSTLIGWLLESAAIELGAGVSIVNVLAVVGFHAAILAGWMRLVQFRARIT